MQKFKGFSIPELLVAVSLLAILSYFAFPVFNSYKQGLEVGESISYVSNFKTEIETCIYERQNITDCDLNSYGVQTDRKSVV